MRLNKGVMHQASGFWDCSIVYNFTVLLFYFFKKKIYWNIGTFELTSLKLLKYKHKIDLKCSKTS
jgi:hypothetical protein